MFDNEVNVNVIVPCFNEGLRVKKVVEEINKCDQIDCLTVVDDGSDEETKHILKKLKDIKLITHPVNKGKAAAIETGISNTSGQIVVFIDADLTNFRVDHLNSLLTSWDEKTAMVLGVRERMNFIARLTGIGIAYTGERLIKRSLLEKNKDIFEVEDYLLEPILNKKFFYENKVKIVWLDGVGQVNKIFKDGVSGFWGDIKMFRNYIQFLGRQEFMRQIKLGLKLTKTTSGC